MTKTNRVSKCCGAEVDYSKPVINYCTACGKPCQTVEEKPSLLPYMAYSDGAGSQEGAILVFAHNNEEAKKVAWEAKDLTFIGEMIPDETDLAIRLMEGHDYIYEEAEQNKLQAGIAHFIECPKTCKDCELWGVSSLNEDGYCENCADDHIPPAKRIR